MKYPILFLPAACYIIISYFKQEPRNHSTDRKDCKLIIDSAKMFVQTNRFAVNTKPTIIDNARNLRLDKWLMSLSFTELTCLLDNPDLALKDIGFVYAMHHNNDSLLKKYSYLLTDTTSIQLFSADGKISKPVAFGKFLSSSVENIKRDNENLNKRQNVENTVSAFILKYATHPDSYRPGAFPYFSVGSNNQRQLEKFKVRHEYSIKDNSGKQQNANDVFVLDKNLIVTVIEKDSTSFGLSYPPQLHYWFSTFGRKLTPADSVALYLK